MAENFSQPTGVLRTTAALTNSYVVFKTFSTGDEQGLCNRATHFFVGWNYTKGSSSSMEMKIEFSMDGTNWFEDRSEVITAGAGVLSAHYISDSTAGLGKYTFPVDSPYIRLSAKCTGAVTSSDLIVYGGFISKAS